MKLRALIGALAVLALALVLLGRQGEGSGTPAAPASGGGNPLAALRAVGAAAVSGLELAPDSDRRTRGPRHLIARVRAGEAVDLLDRPDGEAIAQLGDRTEFGSDRALGVVRARQGWLAVTVPELRDGRLGWVREHDPALELYETGFWIVADLSARLLELRHGRRLLDGFPITIGSPDSPTPVGRYAVTDALAGKAVGTYYGCCILALSGHQPQLPRNWLGGDRIAIHGTPAPVGGAGSAGCLRASDDDMVSLFARVPLGAPVFVRA